MVDIVIFDRLDRRFHYQAQSGTLVFDFLKKEGFPSSSVIVYENNEIVSEFVTTFRLGRKYEIEMVRAYHLPDIMDRSLDLSNVPSGIVYAKNFLALGEDGGGINKIALFDKKTFVKHFEKSFLQSFQPPADIIHNNDKIVVAFSGGRDSLSLILLLSRLKNLLPSISITAVTVNDCIDSLDLGYTVDLCKELGVRHVIKEKSDIEDAFHLSKDFDSVLKHIYSKYGRQHTLYTLHFVMRHMVEQAAIEIGANKIALGLHLEDISASILRSITTGYSVGFPWKRDFGTVNYIYPLWALPKKEITLYLKLTAEQYSRQGSAATFDRGTVDRDVYYALADHANDIWPGFSFHLFEGYAAILRNTKRNTVSFRKCKNCSGTYASFRTAGEIQETRRYCDVCNDLIGANAITPLKSHKKIFSTKIRRKHI